MPALYTLCHTLTCRMPLDFHFNDPMTSESESLLIDKTTTTTGDKLMQWNSSNVQTNFTFKLIKKGFFHPFIHFCLSGRYCKQLSA